MDDTERDLLHRIAAHVVARRRWEVTGRFGLRPTAGGFGTPAFGEDLEVVRVSADRLVHERGGKVRVVPLAGASLADLAGVVGADLSREFAVGHDTPPLGDPAEPLGELDAGPLGDWFTLGQVVLDRVLGGLDAAADPAACQLWPEHFDLGTQAAVGAGVNLGASPGDSAVPEPYLYIGPWTATRPGDPAFWNVPFGAVLRRGEVAAWADPAGTATAFFRRGLTLLGAESVS